MEFFKSLPIFNVVAEKERFALLEQVKANPSPWGKRRLGRYKTVNGKRYQLHATRGWKCVGRATS